MGTQFLETRAHRPWTGDPGPETRAWGWGRGQGGPDPGPGTWARDMGRGGPGSPKGPYPGGNWAPRALPKGPGKGTLWDPKGPLGVPKGRKGALGGHIPLFPMVSRVSVMSMAPTVRRNYDYLVQLWLHYLNLVKMVRQRRHEDVAVMLMHYHYHDHMCFEHQLYIC